MNKSDKRVELYGTTTQHGSIYGGGSKKVAYQILIWSCFTMKMSVGIKMIEK